VDVHTPVETSYQEWAQRLSRWGLNRFAAAFLEASGPLNLICAQLVYIGQPVLSSVVGSHHLSTLAQVLEDPGQTQALINCLREEAAWN
jgi:hypothetical protein